MKRAVATGLIGLAAVLLPVALVLSHRNLVIVFGLIGLAGLSSLWGRGRPSEWVLWLFGLMAYASLTCLWSPYEDALMWPGYLLALGVLSYAAMGAGDRQLSTFILGAGALSLVLLTFEAATGGLIRDITPPESRPDKDYIASGRGVTAALYLGPVLLLVLTRYRRWVAACIVLLCLGIAAASFGITANIVAFMAACIAALFTYRWPRLGLRLMVVGAGVGFFIMPLFALSLPPVETLLALEEGPISWRSRLVIAKAVVTYLPDEPLALIFGHGVESARSLGEELGHVRLFGAIEPLHMIPSHPHNLYLQTWYELGLVGVCLSVTALWRGGQAILAGVSTRDMAAAIAALGGMITVFASVDASFWTLWRVVAPLLGIWLLLHRSPEKGRPIGDSTASSIQADRPMG